MVVSTNGNSSIKDNISNIFGPKQVCRWHIANDVNYPVLVLFHIYYLQYNGKVKIVIESFRILITIWSCELEFTTSVIHFPSFLAFIINAMLLIEVN